MANLKISQLTNGNPAAVGDQIPINRGGTNFSITAGTIASTSKSISTSQLAAVTPAPVITNGGVAGIITWTYTVVAKDANAGAAPASSAGSTTTGNAVLTGSNTNIITWTASTGATSYDVYRTVAGTSPSTTGLIGNTTALTLTDTGLAGDGTTSQAGNSTGQVQASRPGYQGYFSLPGLQVVKLTPAALVAGDNDLYTVPTGMRGILLLTTFNPNVSTSTDVHIQEVKIGGTYYHTNTSNTSSFNSSSTANYGIILEAGQIFSQNYTLPASAALSQVAVVSGTTTYTGTLTNATTSNFAGHQVLVAGFTNALNNGTFTVVTANSTTFTVTTTTQVNETHAATWQDQSGLNVTGTVLLFSNTAPLKSAVLTTFINGNNTLYTCPSGKSAYIAGYSGMMASNTSGSSVLMVNWTGGGLAYSMNFVPNGGSVGTNNLIAQATSQGTNTALNGNLQSLLVPGDFISINTTSTSASQFAWVNVFEQ